MTLKNAIERSISHTEIVSVDYDGERAELMEELRKLYSGEIDCANENNGAVGVWGCGADGEMEWRLEVSLPVVIGEWGHGSSSSAGHIVCFPRDRDWVQHAYDAIADGDLGPDTLDRVKSAGGWFREEV